MSVIRIPSVSKKSFVGLVPGLNKPYCVSGDRATTGVVAVAVADAKLDDRERLRHLQRRQRV